MKTRTLGKTGLQVSEIGFGAWAIGGTSYGPTLDKQSLEALEAAWEAGVNFFDTADTYGHGHSEKLIAKFLKKKPRDKVFLATKVGWDFYHGPSKKNFDLKYLRFAIDESLKRLDSDYVDLYQLHNPSKEMIQQGELVGVLEELKAAGKIRFIGISIYTEEEAMAAMADPRVDSLQLVFNLLDQRMSAQVFTRAKEQNVGVIVREPLAVGFLTGKYKADHVFDKTDHRRRFPRERLELEIEKIGKLKSILATHRLSLSRAALEYVLDFDAVSCVIPGAKTKAQVLENVLASNDPQLRIEESDHLRELYGHDPLFTRFL